MIDTVRAFAVKWLLEPTKKAEGLTISLSKINADGEYLSDAVLELYAVDNVNADKLIVTGGTIEYVYAGSSYSYIRIKTSGGIINVSGLLPGRYSLSEVTAPSGYVNNIGTYYFIVADETVKPMSTSRYFNLDGTAFKIINNRKRQIRFVVCHIDALPYPTEFERNEVRTETYDEEQITDYDDTTSCKSEGLQAVKIYDNGVYIGVTAIVAVKLQSLSALNGSNSNYTDVIWDNGWSNVSGAGDDHDVRLHDGCHMYTRHIYTNMTEASEAIKNSYAASGCPFTPKAATDLIYGPDEEGYYGNIASEKGVREAVINSVYRSAGSICVNSTLSIKIDTTCVNLRKGNNGKPYDWQDVEKVYTYTRSEAATSYITPNPAAYPDISTYVSSTTVTEYMYYGDGLAAESMAEYYAMLKQGTTWDKDIIVDFEN